MLYDIVAWHNRKLYMTIIKLLYIMKYLSQNNIFLSLQVCPGMLAERVTI